MNLFIRKKRNHRHDISDQDTLEIASSLTSQLFPETSERNQIMDRIQKALLSLHKEEGPNLKKFKKPMILRTICQIAKEPYEKRRGISSSQEEFMMGEALDERTRLSLLSHLMSRLPFEQIVSVILLDEWGFPVEIAAFALERTEEAVLLSRQQGLNALVGLVWNT